MDDDGAFSFQTGPGRIVLGAFVSADGPGVSAARVGDEETFAAAPVPLRVLSSDHALLPYVGRIREAGLTQFLREVRSVDPRYPRYVDPEQTASRAGFWPSDQYASCSECERPSRMAYLLGGLCLTCQSGEAA